MIITAVKSLETAHQAVFDVARKANVVLAGYEGLSATLSFSDIAAGIGLDLPALTRTDSFLTYRNVSTTLRHRGHAFSVRSEERRVGKECRL